MAKVVPSARRVTILLESDEDVWFWERRFNVFDFLEIFPASALSPPMIEGQTSPTAVTQLTIETDAGFSFETDIVRSGFYWRNQSRGTRRWMSARQVGCGDTIIIERLSDTSYRLSKLPAQVES